MTFFYAWLAPKVLKLICFQCQQWHKWGEEMFSNNINTCQQNYYMALHTIAQVVRPDLKIIMDSWKKGKKLIF